MAATGRLILAQSKEKFLTAQPPKGLALYLLSTNRGLFYEMHGVLWDVLLQTGVSTLMLNFVKWELDAVSSRGGGRGSCGNLLIGERRNKTKRTGLKRDGMQSEQNPRHIITPWNHSDL